MSSGEKMKRYTIRVELHNANQQNYADLQRYLQSVNIYDIIAANDGRRFKMPPAEYNYEGSLNIEQLAATAKNAISKVGVRYSILITEANRRYWEGLDRIKV